MARLTGGLPLAKKPGSTRSDRYQPDRGDFVFLDFSPHAGTEQAGRRPGLVLSTQAYNVATGLVTVCPVTNQVKGSPWEVPIPAPSRVTGCVLSNQFRNLDWLARDIDFNSKAPEAVLDDVLARIAAVLGL